MRRGFCSFYTYGALLCLFRIRGPGAPDTSTITTSQPTYKTAHKHKYHNWSAVRRRRGGSTIFELEERAACAGCEVLGDLSMCLRFIWGEGSVDSWSTAELNLLGVIQDLCAGFANTFSILCMLHCWRKSANFICNSFFLFVTKKPRKTRERSVRD